MKSYNGFTAEERSAVEKRIRDKVERGEVVKKNVCEMCLLHGTYTMFHYENYADINAYHELCVECHMKLHGRFRRPNTWKNHLAALRRGYTSAIYHSAGVYIQRHLNELDEELMEGTTFEPIEWWEGLSMNWKETEKIKVSQKVQ